VIAMPPKDRSPADTFDQADSQPMPQRALGAFLRAMHAHRQLMARKMAEQGLPPGQAFALKEIAHNDGITQRDLAEIRHISRPSLTVMLQKMERAGLIERRADAHDQRYMRLYLTDEGLKMHEQMHALLDEMLTETVGRLSGADQVELVRLLDKLTDAINAGNPAAP